MNLIKKWWRYRLPKFLIGYIAGFGGGVCVALSISPRPYNVSQWVIYSIVGVLFIVFLLPSVFDFPKKTKEDVTQD